MDVKENKTRRKRNVEKISIEISKMSRSMELISLSIDDDVQEKLTNIYSKSGNTHFIYSNKKLPFENACPFLYMK
jgi:hypothetical protein|uniref:Uncharacterized protein n=1 Tax=viral metagenome TaxID=1070528 RepID=A0A6C0BQR4_9ZZZZ